MGFYTISTKDDSSGTNFNVLNKDITFSNFIKNINMYDAMVCHFTKEFKHISNLIIRRPEIVKVVLLTKTITKQLKSKLNSMSNNNYLLRIVVISKSKIPVIGFNHNGIVDKQGLIEKFLYKKIKN